MAQSDYVDKANFKYNTNYIISQSVWKMCNETSSPPQSLLQFSLSSAVLACDNEQTLNSYQLADSRTYPHISLARLCEFDNWEFDGF